jgi:DNA-binding beta-propeller fold protein YncE
MNWILIGLIAAALQTGDLKRGVQAPGVQIPVLKLKPEAIDNAAQSDLSCADKQSGFGSDWALSCAEGTLARIDSKTGDVLKTIKTGAAKVKAGLAISPDSVWLLTDAKTTLARIDPAENKVVAETRLPAGCTGIVFGEAALWAACPAENRVLRIDSLLNTVTQRIEVSAEPLTLAVGLGAVWAFCKKEGKVERIDPKTNKVTKTIELGVPNTEGEIIAAEGSVWITLPGFPISRIDPKTDKVVQQFVGEGGGSIKAAPGAIVLTNIKQKTIWRLDPRRILATLAE